MPKYTHGMTGTTTYLTWTRNRNRCNNPFNVQYKDYGAKGIKVCKRWDDFNNFLEDMGMQPKGGWLIRRDKKKGFSKENCYWFVGVDKPGRPSIHNLARHFLYCSWNKMMNACYNKFNARYGNNGEQGIKVYGPWHDLVTFINHFKDKPKGARLDRIDRHADFTPENYQWKLKKT